MTHQEIHPTKLVTSLTCPYCRGNDTVFQEDFITIIQRGPDANVELWKCLTCNELFGVDD